MSLTALDECKACGLHFASCICDSAEKPIRYSGAWEGNRFKGVYVTIWTITPNMNRFGYAKEGLKAPVMMPYSSAKDAEKAARRQIKVYGASSLDKF